MLPRPFYDISIWEEIRALVRWEVDRLVQSGKDEISKDLSIREFRGREPVPWQLAQIMEQRGDAWLQRLYDICCNAYKSKGKMPSEEFDRAVWAFCIDPFVMDGDPERILSYTGAGLLQLLLCSVGSPPEQRNLLRVSQKNSCLAIRAKLWQRWYDRLNLALPRSGEPVAAPARADATDGGVTRSVSRVSRNPQPPPPQPSVWESIFPLSRLRSATPPRSTETQPQQTTSCETPILNRHLPATWQSVEISFLSDERIQILNGKKRETHNYAEFGLEDGRDGKPNQAWIVLRAMAQNRGTLGNGISVGLPWPSVEKAIQEIRKALWHHFGIPADPIPFVKGVGYQACFKIGCSPSFHT